MNISFEQIYTKSIGLFDDPKITKAYETNKIKFAKLMYVYLQNAISLFDEPDSIAIKLADYTEPVGTMEVFVSDGTTTTYTLDQGFVLLEGSLYEFIADGEIVTATINTTNRTVTFPAAIAQGKEYSIEQYFPGKFNYDMSGMRPNVVNYIKDILARFLVFAWGENTRNFYLDIQNILTDSDFKVHTSSAALRSKNEWLDQLTTEIRGYIIKLSWTIRCLDYKG